MEISFTAIQIHLFIGAAQGIFLAIVLISERRSNRQANRILAADQFA